MINYINKDNSSLINLIADYVCIQMLDDNIRRNISHNSDNEANQIHINALNKALSVSTKKLVKRVN